jgi:hypothetical protein
MKPLGFAATSLIALLLLAGCATSDVTARRSSVGDEQLVRPGRTIIHCFAATPDDIPADSAIAGHYDRRDTPQTTQEVAVGRRLGDQVAVRFVDEILKTGLPAERAGSGSLPQRGDLIIKGEFVSINEGSRLKRMLIGFGAGSAELKTFVEGYQVTADGLRPLKSVEVKAAGGKMPGMLVPVVGGAVAGSAGTSVAISGSLNIAQEMGPESIEGAAKRTANEIGKVLSEAFKRQNWI